MPQFIYTVQLHMNETDRTKLFDAWARRYDDAVVANDGAFPFAGYERVLDEVAAAADVTPNMRVLDLGIGTGNLAARFAERGCEVWGVDFSADMLARARAKVPGAVLVQANLLGEWPAELRGPFDRVVAAYVFHEFDLAVKMKLLQRIISHSLAENGLILVADIAFPSVAERAEAHRRWADLWDDDEHYWAADEAIAACESLGVCAAFRRVSMCAGVFAFAPGGGDDGHVPDTMRR